MLRCHRCHRRPAERQIKRGKNEIRKLDRKDTKGREDG
jgi:hypothetical protein